MTWQELASRCYTPYSGQKNVCFIESERGHLFPGVRIENVAFPDTIPAVQAALFSCLSEGQKPTTLYVPTGDLVQLKLWVEEFDLSVEIVDQPPQKQVFPVLKNKPSSISGRLIELLDSAIVINSDFPVSAILSTEKGIIEGVNIEVQDWSMGLCAERVALVKALAAGYHDIDGLFVHTRYGEFSSPCGACRQVLTEHIPDIPIDLFHADHSHSTHLIRDLLPFHFSSDRLINKSK